MSTPNEPAPSLLQLVISLRLAAQRLADSASRMQKATSHQREQLQRLSLLRDRIVELLGECRRLSEKGPGQPSSPPPQEAKPSKPVLPPLPPRPRPREPQYRLPASAFVEFSNWQEFEKFRHMPPISDQEVAACDLDELVRRLSGASEGS
ncbi:MAG: hypothetical protein ACLF0G_03305 [Candidatus Brocadiia bacterium]